MFKSIINLQKLLHNYFPGYLHPRKTPGTPKNSFYILLYDKSETLFYSHLKYIT